jgi:thiopurine S-methyltransferase
MDSQFWHDRWTLNEIGFHQADVHPLLVQYWPQFVKTSEQVFVPLCGKSLDMLWLRQQGHSILGIELSPIAVSSFFAENGLVPTIHQRDTVEFYSHNGIEIACGDFFNLQKSHMEQVSVVYDRAALIALPEALQTRYANHLLAILPHRPPIFLITLEYNPSEMAGPPFSTTSQTVEKLFGQTYQITLLSENDVLDDNIGLKNRGLSRLIEKVYWLSSPL